ncbi:uncharacterized protein MKZ38_002104 [Zalerion maritima]|uniref:Uncharacterized protein n=1 Tax=Zalerion maritima TaxID=339359 RepID=A0AAD5WR26_9PEZI|nr:uncharacterized protein MKZ38_002104 [Zalerion maritima]
MTELSGSAPSGSTPSGSTPSGTGLSHRLGIGSSLSLIMSSTFAASRGARSAVGPRTLFLKVAPTPKTLIERRAILRTLDKFGQVSMFKRLDQPDNFISLMSAYKPASNAVACSPIKLTVSNINIQPDDHMIHRWTSSNAPTFTTHIEANFNPEEFEVSSATYDPFRPSFLIHIFPSPKWPHKRMIRASPLHGAWARFDGDRAASYVSADLATRIPSGATSKGLQTWDLESLRYSQKRLSYNRRAARRDFAYPGSVPELMRNANKIMKEAGLLGQDDYEADELTNYAAPDGSTPDPVDPRAPGSSSFKSAFGWERRHAVGNPKKP